MEALAGCSASSRGCSLPTSFSSCETGQACSSTRPPPPRVGRAPQAFGAGPAQGPWGPPALSRGRRASPRTPERRPAAHGHSWPQSSAGSCGSGSAGASAWGQSGGAAWVAEACVEGMGGQPLPPSFPHRLLCQHVAHLSALRGHPLHHEQGPTAFPASPHGDREDRVSPPRLPPAAPFPARVPPAAPPRDSSSLPSPP